MEPTVILRLADLMARHLNRSVMTIARRSGLHTRLYLRLRDGAGCNTSTFNAALQWFADNWPDDLEWPEKIDRPAKTAKEAA
jgi:hypothetical protein